MSGIFSFFSLPPVGGSFRGFSRLPSSDAIDEIATSCLAALADQDAGSTPFELVRRLLDSFRLPFRVLNPQLRLGQLLPQCHLFCSFLSRMLDEIL